MTVEDDRIFFRFALVVNQIHVIFYPGLPFNSWLTRHVPSYQGCVTRKELFDKLPIFLPSSFKSLASTPEDCKRACALEGYKLAGLFQGNGNFFRYRIVFRIVFVLDRSIAKLSIRKPGSSLVNYSLKDIYNKSVVLVFCLI